MMNNESMLTAFLGREISEAGWGQVVPIELAKILKEEELLSDYQLLLAHDVVKHPKEYREVYGDITSRGGTIIMDNSVVELGKPVSSQVMAEACQITRASVAVLPDYLLNKNKTIKSTKRGLEEYGMLDIELMVIPQGKNELEWIQCLEEIGHLGDWIGVPRNFKESIGRSRLRAVNMVQLLFPTAPIHLFGFSDSFSDDIFTLFKGRYGGADIRGIDSAVPVRMGIRDNQLLKLSTTSHKGRGDWWDNWGANTTLKETETMVANIEFMQRLLCEC